MAIPVVEFSRGGNKIRKCFGQKINCSQWNCPILRIGVMVSCQKLGIILENKVIEKCPPKNIFFIEKNPKDSDEFRNR